MSHRIVLIAVTCLLVACSPAGDNRARVLFDGGDLDQFIRVGEAQWQQTDDYVESSDANHSFLLTRDSYSDFRLLVDFYPSPDANSGVFMRCTDLDNIANETCYELNIYDEHRNPDNATGSFINLSAPMTAIKAGNRWNTYDITMRGENIRVELNGTLVADFSDPSFESGPIAFQSNGGLIRFRNIRITPL